MPEWVAQTVEDIDGGETLIDVTDEGVIQIIPATVDLYLGREQREPFMRALIASCWEAERREANGNAACGKERGKYECIRAAGHSGEHEAITSSGEVSVRWMVSDA